MDKKYLSVIKIIVQIQNCEKKEVDYIIVNELTMNLEATLSLLEKIWFWMINNQSAMAKTV